MGIGEWGGGREGSSRGRYLHHSVFDSTQVKKKKNGGNHVELKKQDRSAAVLVRVMWDAVGTLVIFLPLKAPPPPTRPIAVYLKSTLLAIYPASPAVCILQTLKW